MSFLMTSLLLGLASSLPGETEEPCLTDSKISLRFTCTIISWCTGPQQYRILFNFLECNHHQRRHAAWTYEVYQNLKLLYFSYHRKFRCRYRRLVALYKNPLIGPWIASNYHRLPLQIRYFLFMMQVCLFCRFCWKTLSKRYCNAPRYNLSVVQTIWKKTKQEWSLTSLTCSPYPCSGTKAGNSIVNWTVATMIGISWIPMESPRLLLFF